MFSSIKKQAASFQAALRCSVPLLILLIGFLLIPPVKLSKDILQLFGDGKTDVGRVFEQGQALVSFLMVKNMYLLQEIETDKYMKWLTKYGNYKVSERKSSAVLFQPRCLYSLYPVCITHQQIFRTHEIILLLQPLNCPFHFFAFLSADDTPYSCFRTVIPLTLYFLME